MLAVATPAAQAHTCQPLDVLLNLCDPNHPHTPPPDPEVNPDGSLSLAPDGNPDNLAPLPARGASDPAYPLRADGRKPFGMLDNAVNDGGATIDEVAEIAKAMDADVEVLDLYWPMIEPSDENWNMTDPDAKYRAYIKRGVRPIFTIYYTPKFTLSGNDLTACRLQQGDPLGLSPYPYCVNIEPTNSAQADQLGQKLATRYPLAAGFQWRNEPNLTATGAYDATNYKVHPYRYALSLRAFAEGAHAARPATRVLGFTLTAFWNSAETFLRSALNSDPTLPDVLDAISIHPYDAGGQTDPHDPIRADDVLVGAVNDVLDDFAAAADSRLVVSESGVSETSTTDQGWAFEDAPYGTQPANDPSMSDRLIGQYLQIDSGTGIAAARPIDAWVGFTNVDRAGDNGQKYGYGWFRRKGAPNSPNGKLTPKNVFCDWREIVAGLTGPHGLPSASFNPC